MFEAIVAAFPAIPVLQWKFSRRAHSWSNVHTPMLSPASQLAVHPGTEKSVQPRFALAGTHFFMSADVSKMSRKRL